jgi:hypothetical protein
MLPPLSTDAQNRRGEDAHKSDEPLNRGLAWIGVVVTVVYSAAMVAGFGDKLGALKPNEVGDFLAGVFGPIAILWLILGFFQQGIELRQNTQALRQQADELQNSVEQQRDLVEVTRSQVAAEREALELERQRYEQSLKPLFYFHSAGGSKTGEFATWKTRVENLGGTARRVRITLGANVFDMHVIAPGLEHRFDFRYVVGHEVLQDRLTVTYVDMRARPGRSQFRLELDHNGMISDVVPVEEEEREVPAG